MEKLLETVRKEVLAFNEIKSNSQMQFTLSKSLDYNNANANICMTWESAGEKYDIGIYTAEIYIDGVYSSSKTIELK